MNLHAEAIVQNIRALVLLVLNMSLSFYARWCESFLLTVGKYSPAESCPLQRPNATPLIGCVWTES
jgi:hypothetical protein